MAVEMGAVEVEVKSGLVLLSVGEHGFHPQARLEVLSLEGIVDFLFTSTWVELGV
jgi:hypothetical protein